MIIRALLVGLLSAGLSIAAVAADPIVIKFSHVVAPSTPKGKAAERFKELAAKYTNGAAQVEVYANSSLYKDKEEMQALQLGVVQLLAPSLAKFAPLGVREFEVFDLPYIFDGYADLHKITHGPVGRMLLEKLEPRGIKGLAFWDNGFKSFSANTPIHTPADLKGKKMRIQSSRVLEEQMQALQALPQMMEFSEVYHALKTGIVDGTENPHSNLYTQKMHEVQKHMTLTNHGYLGYAVITNRKFWEGLPTDVRNQLDRAMKEATDYANEIAKAENDAALEAVRASGRIAIYTPSDAERAEFKKTLVAVHKKMESRIGADLIKSIYEDTGFDPSKM